MSRKILVEIAYALPERQVLIPLKMPEGTTAEEAIRASGVIDQFPEIDLAVNSIGIFGKPDRLDAILRDRDRVEIYRPLIANPKEIRRQRANESRGMKKAAS
jgi:putative ubiquitin-RnfH superfamily antitoxin RatB of RatAB toxin-antitoxin module